MFSSHGAFAALVNDAERVDAPGGHQGHGIEHRLVVGQQASSSRQRADDEVIRWLFRARDLDDGRGAATRGLDVTGSAFGLLPPVHRLRRQGGGFAVSRNPSPAYTQETGAGTRGSPPVLDDPADDVADAVLDGPQGLFLGRYRGP